MAIWDRENNASYNKPCIGEPSWLTDPVQKLRWHRLRQARMLFEGRHWQFYLADRRTQFDYPEEKINGEIRQRYLTVNLLRLLSLKIADLLFGAKPKLEAKTQQQSDQLDLLARRSLIHSRFHTAAVQASWAGGAFLESCLWDGEAYLMTIEPDDIFPVGIVTPAGQYQSYVRYATANIGTTTVPVIVLLETTYNVGTITRELYQLNGGGVKSGKLALNLWPAFGNDIPPDEQKTGLDVNTITYLPNVVDGRYEVSDYDGLIELQDTVNAKFAQISRVIATHADPNIAFPESAVDANGNIPVRSKVHFFRSKDDIPQYIVWSAQLEAAMQDRDAALNAFCMVSELAQVLLGLKQGATPDAARKVRLECTNTLSKVGRKVLLLEPTIPLAIETTQRLDQTSVLSRSYPVDPIACHLRDGLPVDGTDVATEASLWAAAKGISIEGIVSMRIEDPVEAAMEVERIKQEQAEAMPAVLGALGGETQAERDQPPEISDKEAA